MIYSPGTEVLPGTTQREYQVNYMTRDRLIFSLKAERK